MIPVFCNTLGAEEVEAVRRVYESRWLGPGKEVAAFEAEWHAHLNRGGTVMLTNSCTSALYLALRALRIGRGDEVIVPTVQFVATASLLEALRAKVVFADVDAHTLNILPGEIDRLRTDKTRAVVLLHYGGHPCDMRAVINQCGGIDIIEDAANAPASTWCDMACGGLGVAGVWSFDAMKILVMGDGGALWIREDDVAERARMLRYLGLAPDTRSGMDRSATAQRWWEYDVVEPSGRYISNDVSAAVGRVQLGKMGSFVARRHAIWDTYQRELAGVGDLRLPPEPLPDCTSSYYLYWVQTGRRDDLAVYLKAHGVYTTFRYFPLHLVPHFADGSKLPRAEWANEHTLCLPLHQALSDDDVAQVIEAVRGFYA